MALLETSMILATLVGLLCNWKQERGAAAQDRFQDFIIWLEQHNFNDLRDRIIGSDVLQQELNLLLREDLSALSTKLDSISSGIYAIAGKLDHFSAITQFLVPGIENLSQQACQLLKEFVMSGKDELIVWNSNPSENSYHALISPGGPYIKVGKPRLLGADLDDLMRLNLLRKVPTDKKKHTAFGLTNPGEVFASMLPEDRPLIQLEASVSEPESTFIPFMIDNSVGSQVFG